MLKINTAQLLQAEMDRKAFLKNAGIAFAGIIGVSAIVKNINSIGGAQATRPGANTSGFGYGGSAYGGNTVGR